MSLNFPKMYVNLFRKPLTGKHKVNQPTTLTLSVNYQCYNHYLFMSEIKPVFATSTNIVFCCNRLYLPYLSVVLTSLISHTQKTHHYDIVILYNQRCGPPRYHPKKFCRPNISVRLIKIDLEKLSNGADFFVHRYYVPEVYARFFIPQILTAYRKILYLDIDMLILDDVAKLYQFDLGDYSLAATRDFVSLVDIGVFTKNFELYLSHDLELKQRHDYFCSGVMLMDLLKLRQEKFTRRCLARLQKIATPLYVDQDVLNCLFAGRVKYLPERWNIMLLCFDSDIIERVKKTNNDNQQKLLAYWRMMDNPGIIHFSGGVKPWLKRSSPFASWWWQVAWQSPFFGRIVLRKFKQHFTYLWEQTWLVLKNLANKIKHFFQGLFTIIHFAFLVNRQQTVLLIEGNTFHGEVLHSLLIYYRQLGCRLVLLINPALLEEGLGEVLPRSKQIKIFSARALYLRFICHHFNLTKFRAVIFNSREIAHGGSFITYQQYFALKQPLSAWCIRHHLPIKKLKNSAERALVLLKNPQYGGKNLALINYGQTVNKKLSKKRVLVVIGSLDYQRKNFPLLLQAVATLIKTGETNFTIEMIGSSQPVGLSPRLSKYFNFHGRVSYSRLYQLIAGGDFILSLLDPVEPAHQQYRLHRATGSVLSSFAFLKPCLMEQSFATAYELNQHNSLLYAGNQQLIKSIKQALQMSPARYQRLVANLAKDKKRLQEQTLLNLKQTLGKQ